MTVPERPTHILVVDDEEQIRRALKSILSTRGYSLELAATGQDALLKAIDTPPDLVVLDLMLPDISGIEVCRELRTWMTAPILILSVRSNEADKITALDEGADDYLTKPFSAGELLARIRALLRRSAALTSPPPIIRAGELEVDVARRRVRRAGAEVALTPTEFDILAFLARNAGLVVHAAHDPRAGVGARVGRGRADAARAREQPAQEDRATAGRTSLHHHRTRRRVPLRGRRRHAGLTGSAGPAGAFTHSLVRSPPPSRGLEAAARSLRTEEAPCGPVDRRRAMLLTLEEIGLELMMVAAVAGSIACLVFLVTATWTERRGARRFARGGRRSPR